jgi:hypothetical protein
MTVDDLEALVRAYRASEDRTVRIGLFRLIESVTLSRFLPKRMGATPAWTPEMFDQGMAALETEIARWESRKCSLGVNGILAARMAEMGAPVSNPRSAEACAVWLNVMRVGDESWWPTAAKQLYLCGGPWIELSVLWSDSAENRARRDRFLDWYRPPIKKPEPTKTPVFPAP